MKFNLKHQIRKVLTKYITYKISPPFPWVGTQGKIQKIYKLLHTNAKKENLPL